MFDNDQRDRLSPTPILLVLFAVMTAGCAAAPDGSSPTSTMAKAQLTVEGTPFTFCEDSCVFEGSGANRGLGCAANVEGRTRVLATDGSILALVEWQLGAHWIVRPAETFLYDGCCFDPDVMKQEVRYETDFRWDDVACPLS